MIQKVTLKFHPSQEVLEVELPDNFRQTLLDFAIFQEETIEDILDGMFTSFGTFIKSRVDGSIDRELESLASVILNMARERQAICQCPICTMERERNAQNQRETN